MKALPIPFLFCIFTASCATSPQRDINAPLAFEFDREMKDIAPLVECRDAIKSNDEVANFIVYLNGEDENEINAALQVSEVAGKILRDKKIDEYLDKKLKSVKYKKGDFLKISYPLVINNGKESSRYISEDGAILLVKSRSEINLGSGGGAHKYYKKSRFSYYFKNSVNTKGSVVGYDSKENFVKTAITSESAYRILSSDKANVVFWLRASSCNLPNKPAGLGDYRTFSGELMFDVVALEIISDGQLAWQAGLVPGVK